MTKYAVFSLRVANELVKQGFQIVSTGINIKNPKYTVFYFEETEQLKNALTEIIQK